jgi:hypothetical protein
MLDNDMGDCGWLPETNGVNCSFCQLTKSDRNEKKTVIKLPGVENNGGGFTYIS